MSVRKRQYDWVVGIGVGLAVVAGLGIFVAGRRAFRVGSSDESSAARDAETARTSAQVIAAFPRWNWPDMATGAGWLATNSSVLERARDADRATMPPAARYAVALAFLARQHPDQALEMFNSIPAGQLPALHLYPPHRLHLELRPGQSSPWGGALEAALRDGQLPPLIAARVHAGSGRFAEAVAAYLSSDPAEWASHDVALLSTLLHHSGAAPEAARLIGAAIRAGRLTPPVQAELARILDRAGTGLSAAGGAREFLRAIRENPVAMTAAARAATNQLEIRRAFVGRHDGDLLRRFAGADPMSLPNETVLLLVLSSARGADRPAFDRWSQELKRRSPTPVVTQWIREIKAAIP